jgi:surface polysaccharide O-acyltransferase-like enzyme
MTLKVEQPVALICIWLWIGFVCAISFMEAWLKFQAPGVTIAIGLGIGQLVFAALNKVEWVFTFVSLLSLLWYRGRGINLRVSLLLLPVCILIIQTLWLLPQLDIRAQVLIAGKVVAPSSLHLYFIGAEVIKVVSLSLYGITLFNE